MYPTDRPDDATIQDDEALDKWYQSYIREQALKYSKKDTDGNFGGRANIPQFGRVGAGGNGS